MKRPRPFLPHLIGLICAALLIWAAPFVRPVRAQAATSTPTRTPQAVTLTVEGLKITPGVVVAGDPFFVAFSIWNRTDIFIEQLAVTASDLDTDALLSSSTGAKTTYYNRPGRGVLAAVELRLVYAGAAAGTRRMALRLEYAYFAAGRLVSASQVETLSLLVAAPTATPTVTPTFTPTPTRTPSATPTRRPTLAPPTVDYPATQIVLLQTVAAQARPTAVPTPAVTPTATWPPPPLPPPQPRPLPPSRGGVVIEFEGAPQNVEPGQVFTMTLVVSNVGPVEATAVIASFDTATSAIVPIGRSTQWFLDVIPPGGRQAMAGQFYVAADGPLGRAQVRVEYDDGSGEPREVAAEIYVPTIRPTAVPSPIVALTPTPTPRGAPQPAEPWWLRILRAIFGGGN